MNSNSSKVAFDPANVGIEAVSGILHDISDDFLGPVPFVCFRGSVEPAHIVTREELTDLISCQLEDKAVPELSKEIDTERCKYLHKYKNLRELCLTKHHVNFNDGDAQCVGEECLLDWCCKNGAEYVNGLLICGHSLGGAMASLFAAEVFSNYGTSIPLHLITFGAPKVFSSKTAAEINQCPYRNLRFCNNNDLVLSLGAPHHHPTGKTCKICPLPQDDGGENLSIADGQNEKSSTSLQQRRTTGHEWVSVPSAINSRQVVQKSDISLEEAKHSHSLSGSGGYFDNLIHSSTYQQALDRLYNKDVRESYELMNSLIHAERQYHFLHFNTNI